MKELASGKDAVLAFLEAEAERLTGRPGAYAVYEDDRGGRVFVVAGLVLTGELRANAEQVFPPGTHLRLCGRYVVEIHPPG